MASSATLTTLRARLLTQLQGASGETEELAVTASAETLATLRDRVELMLQDSSNARWATADLDEAIQEAVWQYSRQQPNAAIGTITLAAAGREVSLTTLTGLIRVLQVWWDYDSGTPDHPPHFRQFEVWPGSLLYINDPTQPAKDDVVRVWYTKVHTLKDLASAAATTIPADDITYIIIGAAYFAVQQRIVELSETLNTDDQTVKNLTAQAEEWGKNFRYGIALRPPAWQRYQSGYDQDDLDEALRWALHRYSQVAPVQAIGTLTLAASGREVSVSTLTGYMEVMRVWWNYDSTDPGHPPVWRRFELWPGDILYINDDEEPAVGDKVRVWYTKLHTLNGLDAAAATTFPADADTILITGAAGYAAQEREQEQQGRGTPTRLREWATARLEEFEKQLQAVARRWAARQSGIAEAPSLDRWDTGETW
jgi:hypothetical protein